MTDPQSGYLRDEYLLLQNIYEDYDRRSLQIKGWMMAATVGGFALGFDADKNTHGVIWISIATFAICIWYLEARWKTFQHALTDRIRILEAYFRNDPEIFEKNPAPFQIYHAWFQSAEYDKPIYPYEARQEQNGGDAFNLLMNIPSRFSTRTDRPWSFVARLITSACHDFVFLPYLPIIVICTVAYKWT